MRAKTYGGEPRSIYRETATNDTDAAAVKMVRHQVEAINNDSLHPHAHYDEATWSAFHKKIMAATSVSELIAIKREMKQAR